MNLIDKVLNALTGSPKEPSDKSLKSNTIRSEIGENHTLVGTDGDDKIRGTSREQDYKTANTRTVDGNGHTIPASSGVVDAKGGNDSIATGSGNDVVNAGSGNDTISDFGGDTNTLNGGTGDDSFLLYNENKSEAHFTVNGGSGDDTILMSENASSSITMGDGNDTLIVNGDSTITDIEAGDKLYGFGKPEFEIGEKGDLSVIFTHERDKENKATLGNVKVTDLDNNGQVNNADAEIAGKKAFDTIQSQETGTATMIFKNPGQ